MLPPLQLPDAVTVRPQTELTQTPFFPQRRYQCGPAALATALVASGVDITPDILTPEVYLPGRQGSLQLELLAATRRHGRIAYVLTPELPAVLAEVAAGHPVVVLQNLAFNWYPLWHYAVVIGFDLQARELILRSGTHDRITIPFDTFRHTWQRSGNWALLVLAPDQLPATADESRYVKAVAGLERAASLAAARTGYQTAAMHWPDSLAAQIGLANISYLQGDLAAAEYQYRALVARYPQQASLYNNLAQVLFERGRRAEALEMIRRAIEIGGPLIDSYRQTLQQFEAQ